MNAIDSSNRPRKSLRDKQAAIDAARAEFEARGQQPQQIPTGLSGLDKTGLGARGRAMKNKQSKGIKNR